LVDCVFGLENLARFSLAGSFQLERESPETNPIVQLKGET